ncbi:MAG: L-threonylcarbamoyladenylate synthase [Nanoarchaeota archaeon]
MHFSKNIVNKEEAIELLKKGEVLIIPTDTLFGIITNAFNKEAVEKIYKIKGRDENKPLLLLTDDFNKVRDFLIVENWHKFFIEEWPAPLTLIFKVKEEFKEKLFYLHRGKNKIAVRIPDKKELIEFLKELDFPIVAPSANPQGLKPAKNIDEAYNYFKDKVCYLNTKEELEGKPSTIIDLSEFPPKIIREGKKKLFFGYFKFFGHEKIKATHKYTFEITKENFLTEKGTCIIGVNGFSNKEFQEKTKELRELTKIKYLIFVKNKHYDRGVAYLVKNENPSNISFVVRRSTFVDERTGLIKSNKTSSNLNRKLIKDLQNKEEAFFLFKEVKVNSLIIDLRSLLFNELINFLPNRIRKRINLEKNRELFDKDVINILKKEKFIQNLDLLKEKIKEELEKEKSKEKIKKEIHLLKEKIEELSFFDLKEIIIFNRSPLLNEESVLLLKEIIKKIFNLNTNQLNLKEMNFNFKTAIYSLNSHLLKKAKKKESSTFSKINKYYVDFLITNK